MFTFLKYSRRALRFSVAVFLWAHALFFLSVRPTWVAGVASYCRLAAAEVVLFGLLLLFSVLAGSGFWRSVGNLAYIYFFPFVLLFYLVAALAWVLIAIGRSFASGSRKENTSYQAASTNLLVGSSKAVAPDKNVPSRSKVVAGALLRPVNRFTLLWCLLLVFASHSEVVWGSLVVVVAHLARTVWQVVQITWFSTSWVRKLEEAIRKAVDSTLDKVSIVTKESAPTDELRNLWTSVQAFETGVRLLEDQALVAKWTWVICAAFLGSVYVYIGFIFSFVYYGAARATGVSFSWPQSLVTSLFIPFLIGDLPRTAGIKLLGALHCSLIVSVGAGTIINYLRKRLESLRTMATIVSVRLADERIKEKYLILQDKFARLSAPNGAPTSCASQSAIESTLSDKPGNVAPPGSECSGLAPQI